MPPTGAAGVARSGMADATDATGATAADDEAVVRDGLVAEWQVGGA